MGAAYLRTGADYSWYVSDRVNGPDDPGYDYIILFEAGKGTRDLPSPGIHI